MNAFGSNLFRINNLPLLDMFFYILLRNSTYKQRKYFLYRLKKIKYIKSYKKGIISFTEKGYDEFIKMYWIFWNDYQKLYSSDDKIKNFWNDYQKLVQSSSDE
jgi:hypothetical protein